MPTLQEPPTTPPQNRRRKRLLSENEDVRSTQTGIILTVVLWPIMVWLFNLGMIHLGGDYRGMPKASQSAKPAFNIEMDPDAFIMPQKPPPPNRFVETNPDAPENIPDDTRNFASRNQQVAQEKPTPNGKNDSPALEGKKDFQSNQIVNGQLSSPKDAPPPVPPPNKEIAAAMEQAARKAQNPLPGSEDIKGDSPEGIGASVAPDAPNATAVKEKIPGVDSAPLLVGDPRTAQQRIDPLRPQPRKRLSLHARPAILAENRMGTSNVGPTAIDARWSNYGAYLQRLIETVQIEWERILDETKATPPPGSEVTVKFRLEATAGKVSEIINADSTGGEQAKRTCISAITARSPYGKWTDDMVAVLGESQEMTFTFYYY